MNRVVSSIIFILILSGMLVRAQTTIYIDQCGSLSGRTGWPILNDSTTIAGDASMGVMILRNILL